MRNERLVQARVEKGLTQYQLSVFLKCEKSTISNWENGYSTPRLNDAIALSIILEKDIFDIFFENKEKVSCTMRKRINELKKIS